MSGQNMLDKLNNPFQADDGNAEFDALVDDPVAPETFDDEFDVVEDDLATLPDGLPAMLKGFVKDDEADGAIETDALASPATEDPAAPDDHAPEPAPASEEPDGLDPAILAAMAAAEQQSSAPDQTLTEEGAQAGSVMERVAPAIIWMSLACVIGAIAYALIMGVASGVAWLILASGVCAMAGLLIWGALTKSFSPVLLTGLMFHRARGRKPAEAIQLAGRDILVPLGIAEDVLNVDVDARLVTSRDGVVVYANDAYIDLARSAGIRGASGLPPRLDRLFAQAGPEARKMFRLFRSARSGLATEEIVTQIMGTDNPRPRRFEIALRPMKDQGEHIAWRLRELEVENVADTMSSAYRDYPRPVFALEASGQIAWYNEAMQEWIGTISSNLQLSDFILGEAGDVISALWDEEGGPLDARMRRRKGGSVDVTLTPFSRGGIGEGFVIVELQPQELGRPTEEAVLSGDITDAPFGVAMVEGDIGSDAVLAEANKVFRDLFAIEQAGNALTASFSDKVLRDLSAAIRARSGSSPLARPVEVKLGEGKNARIVHLFAKPVKRRRGSYGKRQTVLYSVDVSFQKRMEEDYSQDQKLKTIGHLAGSIAHDFNNLLLVVMGSCEMLMRRHTVGDPSYPELVLIQQHAQRAKTLTSNLLAFSRKQTLQSEVVEITEMLRDFSPFLNRSITERVSLNVINGRGLPAVKADKGQLELAIMNLAVNARDAMPEGGKLTIETKSLSAEDVAGYDYTGLDNVDHVLIEVSDTGSGVPEDIADQIFEPFFTTKGEGKGTGLGLSTVYGVIGQMGGRIFLHNRPGEGATFRIFLPAYEVSEEERAAAAEAEKKARIKEPSDLTGKGRVLIVEDEDGARSLISRTLQLCGYEITEACDGEEALEIIEDERDGFDLILSDIMMPEMDGPTMIQRVGDQLGDAKVIFMSGYAEAEMRNKLDEIAGSGYLQKPFTMKTVAARVKEALKVVN